MATNPILTQSHPPCNGQPTPQARAFVVAFIPAKSNLTQLWSLKASEAIGVLIDFRSSIHRWLASGQVNEAEFAAAVETLESAGLACFIDELIAAGMAGGEQ